MVVGIQKRHGVKEGAVISSQSRSFQKREASRACRFIMGTLFGHLVSVLNELSRRMPLPMIHGLVAGDAHSLAERH